MSAPQRQRGGLSADIAGPRLILGLSVFALVLIGLVMVYSTSSVNAIDEGLSSTYYIVRQLVYTLIGVGLAFVFWKLLPHRIWAGRVVWVVWGVAMLLLAATAVAGTENYGATRWLKIGSFSLQPSEFAKIAFILVAARILADYLDGLVEGRAALVAGLLFVVLPVALLVYKVQSDLGTTVIIFVGIYAMLWIGGVSWKALLGLAGVGFLFILCSIFLTDYRSGRMVYLNPWNDGENGYGTGYNIIRSYYAIAEGGLFGVGLGGSHEKYQYLFASESDFIFAILSEELGMAGALFVIGLFVAVLVAGLRVSATSGDTLGKLIAAGCTIMLVFQAFLNIGCVIGVLPTTGKPLPFISSGGSSMMSSMILVGLILSVSKAAEEPSVYERRRADLRLVRSVDERDHMRADHPRSARR